MRGKRFELAAAYLVHPDPQVRMLTIGYAKDMDRIGIRQYFVDLLVDSSDRVRSVAAQAIWEREDVLFSLRALKDEFSRTGFVSHMTPQEAVEGIQVLKSAQPNREEDFNKWMREVGLKR